MTFIYIDESGDLGPLGSKYFTIAAVVVEEPKHLGRVIKKIRERRLKKSVKKCPEIKANNSQPHIRKAVLERIARLQNCKIYAIVVKKEKIYDRLFRAKDKLYNYICGILLQGFVHSVDGLEIIIDKKYTNTFLREDFNSYIQARLKGDIKIKHELSQNSNELLATDFVVWAINRKFNLNDPSYYQIIECCVENKENVELWA